MAPLILFLAHTGNGNPEFANLPRKFNVAFVGSKEAIYMCLSIYIYIYIFVYSV
jgi:sulfite reductase beta subunit-like hemoprotein